jgi:DNA-binding transcriptional LysR family regulator
VDLNGVAIFVKVVQAGNFSRAAKLLGMPNSTVSARIADLEKRLGVTLLQRTTRKLRVTEAGEAYFRHCAQALDELQWAEDELASTQREPHGLLRLSAPVDIGHNFLATLVHAYLQKYPSMGVELVLTNRVVDLVSEGIDIAIRAGKLADSRLIAKKFTLGNFALWASPAYLKKRGAPAHPRDLAHHDCIRFSLFKAARLELTNGKQSAAVKPAGRLSADDFSAVKALAFIGEGIAYLPEFLCADEAGQETLQRVLPQWRGSEVTFSFVYPRQQFVSPKVRGFIDAAAEVIKRTQALAA